MPPTGFDPNLFLEFAQKIVKDRKYEERSRARVAVGRAYYSAFLQTQRKLGELGFAFGDVHRIHKQVIDNLREVRPDLGDKLSTLFDRRVDADYFMNVDIREETGKNSINIASFILNTLPSVKRN